MKDQRMSNYVLTNRALKDLSDIWNYTYDTWSEIQADKYYYEILKECSRLSENLQGGREYFYLIADLKGAKINKHIIFFRRQNENEIEVERILHERMDFKTRLQK